MSITLFTIFFFILSILNMEKLNSWESEFVAELPKIELHLHLDGSLSPGENFLKYDLLS